MEQRRSAEDFLGENPTLEQRWQALRVNVQSCYERQAHAEGKMEIGRVGEMQWTYSQWTIPSEEALQDGQQIDSILDWYRRQQPLHGAICWYLHPTPPTTLGARLFARGVGPNWTPHWMWLECSQLHNDPPRSDRFEIQISTVEETSDAESKTTRPRTAQDLQKPRQVWRLRALQEGQGVGGCVLNVTRGERGIGGLFDMWVMPEARKQGIGTALAQATGELARQLGCHHVALNATEMGEPVYRRVGFQSMGYGYTWYLDQDALAAPAPSSNQILFLEAIGLGNSQALDEIEKQLTNTQLEDPTLNGMTPLEIAVRCQQPVSAEWLIEHDIVPDIISVWDLGWKERVPALLAEHPELVRRRGGRWDATPLHSAIERNDIELARLLLTVPNDLKSKDAVFQSTPFGWARHFQRREILALLRQARTRQQSS